jgi:hypothetical protein
MVMGPDRARNQELLCWRWPEAIYWTGEDKALFALGVQAQILSRLFGSVIF